MVCFVDIVILYIFLVSSRGLYIYRYPFLAGIRFKVQARIIGRLRIRLRVRVRPIDMCNVRAGVTKLVSILAK